jgi:hypoxanthine-DNA glycosylase
MVSAINKTALEIGFPAIADTNAKVLILGSMPSVQSLQQQQYYAHPRNAFWPIMARLFEFELNVDYLTRCQKLQQHNIAVWDSLKACQRQGSLDQNIDTNSMIVNDFNAFFQHHPNIQHLFFNGGKAEQVFKQRIFHCLNEPFKSLPHTRLPSTSPAHATMNFEQKLHCWQQLLSLSTVQ